MRDSGRANNALRKLKIKRNYMKFAEGSCLIELGNTKVICTASVEQSVPPWMRGKKTGWVTGEYGMLPRSCGKRIVREAARGKVGGRTQEIQRLIGRSLRTVTDMTKLGERTIWVDADVLQGDGGTRCAAITGGFIALCDALNTLKRDGVIDKLPISDFVAAISVGMIGDDAVLDLDYGEDSGALVDMNIVMTGAGKFIEIQGTAERDPFTAAQMDKMVGLAKNGISKLIAAQRKALGKVVDW